MSLLQEVIEQYGISENPKAPTDKTAKTSKKPNALTDKTAKTSSVSFGSEWSELLENKNGELEEHQIPVATDMVAITEMRERGIVPDHDASEAECNHCGPVPLFEGCPPQVNGCPWCFNRIKRLPMPNKEAHLTEQKKWVCMHRKSRI